MRSNPLREYLDDDLFYRLWEMGFLNERAVRDHYIRQRFNQLKASQKPKEIITDLQAEFPYLSVETVRKIVYSKDNGISTLQF